MKKIILSLIMAGVTSRLVSAGVQPEPKDYASFSQFIAARDIFDSSRQPYNNSIRQPLVSQPRLLPNEVRLVGTMSYGKGLFAFFDGTSANLSRVLQVGDKIADCTITDITRNFVRLATTDTQVRCELIIGSALREEKDKWVPVENAVPVPTSSSGDESAGSTPAAPPPSTGEQNDVLKRLMELREKENQ